MPSTISTSAFEEVVLDWCDSHNGHVAVGRTQPYSPGSRYRWCDDCQAKAQARLEARERYCSECHYLTSLHRNGRCPAELGPNGARSRAREK